MEAAYKKEIDGAKGDSLDKTVTGEYFRFRLEAPLLWSQQARDEFARCLPVSSLKPYKCGEGMRFFQTGLLKLKKPNKIQETISIQGNSLLIAPISESTFSAEQLSIRNKVFFKGFPFNTTKQAIKQVLQEFGKAEYVYFMCNPKKSRLPCKMGYVIFDCRESVENLLRQGPHLTYEGRVVTFEEYRTSRKMADSLENSSHKETMSKQIVNCQTIEMLNPLGIGEVLTGDGRSPSNISRHKAPPKKDKIKFKLNSSKLLNLSKPRFFKGQPWLDSTRQIHTNSNDCNNIRFNILKPAINLRVPSSE